MSFAQSKVIHDTSIEKPKKLDGSYFLESDEEPHALKRKVTKISKTQNK